MSVEEIIYNYIFEERHIEYSDKKKLEQGIIHYVEDNGLDAMSKNMDDVQKRQLIEAFIEPMFNVSEEARVYFENYDLLMKLKLLSNRLLDIAEMTYRGRSTDVDVAQLKDELSYIVDQMYNDESLRKSVDLEVSECLLDLDYIMGITDKMSIRLSRRVKVIMFIRIHDFVPKTRALGPEERFAIWFQGCNRMCKGCMSPETRNVKSGHLIETEDIYNYILQQKSIEGITISGGEPFLQIDGLYELLAKICKRTTLGVMLYTGYTVTELRKLGNDRIDEILDSYVDILIDGQYIDELNDGINLRGSSNQNVIFLTDRYKGYRDLFNKKGRNVEIYATPKNVVMVGVPTKTTLQEWHKITAKDGQCELSV